MFDTIKSFFSRLISGKKISIDMQDDDSIYVQREPIEDAIASQIQHKKSFVLYGPPGQGKTALVTKMLNGQETIYIECHLDFKRANIYRLILSSIGFSMTTEKKKKISSTMVAKFGLFGAKVEATGNGEVESSSQEITIDLKNASEVAFLLSKINKIPYIVFNNFQLLSNKTKKSLLYDLSFFIERTKMKFIIVGAWFNEDYIELVQPNLRSLLNYIYVPYWDAEDIKKAFLKWNKIPDIDEKTAKIINEFNSLCQGDISLFQYMSFTLSKKLLLADAKNKETLDLVKKVIIDKSKADVLLQLKSFMEIRDIYLSYDTMEAAVKLVDNPKFNTEQESYKSSTVNPKTEIPYRNGEAVDFDSKGNPRSFEIDSSQLVKNTKEIGSQLIRSFHTAINTDGVQSIPVTRLIEENGLLNKEVMSPNLKIIKNIYENIESYQLKNQIFPFLFSYDGPKKELFISNQKFYLFLQSVSDTELEDFIEDILSDDPPSPRKRNNISVVTV